jgi:uncharacterized protein DUF5134
MSGILIGDLALRWIVTMLFGVSIATYAYIVVAQYCRWTSTISHLLHLTMSAAMILMVWRVGMNLPIVGPLIFCLLAGAWFVRVAIRVSATTRERLTNGYYAVMMAAMAWMYASMHGSLPGHPCHSPDHAQSASLSMNMSGVEMSAREMPATSPELEWITTVNWIATVGFAIAAVYWPCHYFANRRTNLVPHAVRFTRVELLYQATTAAGTALMFAMML